MYTNALQLPQVLSRPVQLPESFGSAHCGGTSPLRSCMHAGMCMQACGAGGRECALFLFPLWQSTTSGATQFSSILSAASTSHGASTFNSDNKSKHSDDTKSKYSDGDTKSRYAPFFSGPHLAKTFGRIAAGALLSAGTRTTRGRSTLTIAGRRVRLRATPSRARPSRVMTTCPAATMTAHRASRRSWTIQIHRIRHSCLAQRHRGVACRWRHRRVLQGFGRRCPRRRAQRGRSPLQRCTVD